MLKGVGNLVIISRILVVSIYIQMHVPVEKSKSIPDIPLVVTMSEEELSSPKLSDVYIIFWK